MTKAKAIKRDRYGQIKQTLQPPLSEKQPDIPMDQIGAESGLALELIEAEPHSYWRVIDQVRLRIGRAINWFVEPARIAANIGDDHALNAMRVTRRRRRLSKAARPLCPDRRP